MEHSQQQGHAQANQGHSQANQGHAQANQGHAQVNQGHVQASNGLEALVMKEEEKEEEEEKEGKKEEVKKEEEKEVEKVKGLKGFSTVTCHADWKSPRWDSQDIVPPISMTVLFETEDPSDILDPNAYCYSKLGNPTRRSLEQCLAAIEGAKYAFVFPTGVSAMLATAFLLRSGDHIVCTTDVYGGTYQFLTTFATRMGLHTTFVNCQDLRKFEEAFRPNTKMVLLETMSNPTLKILDVPALVTLTRRLSSQALVMVDNALLTPYQHKSLEMGVDIVLHSVTKYMNGHGDVLMGSLALNDSKLAENIKDVQSNLGLVPSSFCCFLVSRGLRTLELRMLRHCDSTLQIARALESNPRVSRVLYPGLPSHPQHQLAKQLLTNGCGGVVSVYVNATDQQVRQFLKHLEIFALAGGLGNHTSLIQLPYEMTHRFMPEEARQAIGITPNLLRLAIGLENARDLILDLEQALQKAIPCPAPDQRELA